MRFTAAVLPSAPGAVRVNELLLILNTVPGTRLVAGALSIRAPAPPTVILAGLPLSFSAPSVNVPSALALSAMLRLTLPSSVVGPNVKP